MPQSLTSYDARARAPLLGDDASRPPPWSGESLTIRPPRRTLSRSSGGPGFEPLTLTAYETGKSSRHRHEREEDTASSSGSDESSSDGSDSSSEDGRAKPVVASATKRTSTNTVTYLLLGVGLVLLLAAAVYLYRNRASSDPASESSPTTPRTTSASSDGAQSPSRSAAETRTRGDTAAAASSSVSESSTATNPSSDSAATSTSSPISSQVSSKTNKENDSAPSEYSGITLAGTFVDTASYAVATGTAGYVGDEKANADMSKIDVEPNAELVKDKEGKIWVGDVTFYAAGKGGYGSCGTKLFASQDGQDIFFAAMSVYDLMGSASPAPFCYSCIALQKTKDPSKTITAIVADSCPACTLAHVDLEQKAFFALGGTVDMGTFPVAWTFVDCPDGWSKEAMEKISDSVYEAVE